MTQILQVKVDGTGSGMRLDATAGKHEIAVDEPASMGGNDSAADPLSTFLAALLACENVMAQIIAKEMSFDLQKISFDVEGSIDISGLMGDLEVDPKFQEVTVQATLQTSETQARINELQKMVDLRCPLFRTIKDAGVPIRNIWTKA
ncbi:OsmC family protein [Robertmurraya sp. DFI.2.37]|jgi:uncharacterized OsmC-like protein|uniref:OsmC family protein n=1 Tax=Robertmurraya sp. DFI.2.37 TaxID=3031819 RepID=UPI001245650C|nr:OsmC family protein [Robertmurraya sp. DFI.2.37]MDF1508101.1 OsmC family protein [Robertmurraya sp. DFI.2.37]